MFWLSAWIGVILSAGWMGVSNAESITELPKLGNDSVLCSPYPSMFVSDEYLENAGIDSVDKIILVDSDTDMNAEPACTATRTDFGYWFSLDGAFGECAANITAVDASVRKVTYYIRVIPTSSGVISRASCIFIRVCCYYETVLKGGVQPLLPLPKLHNVIVYPVKVHFSADGSFYSDDGFGVDFPNNMVLVNEWVYVGIWLNNVQGDIFLQGDHCWATADSDPYSLPRYTLINEGCPYSDSRTFEFGFSNHYYFAFRAFTWNGIAPIDQRLFVHCDMSVCGASIDTDCLVPFCARKKRALPNDVIEGDDDSKIVSVGPLQVASDKDEIADVIPPKSQQVVFEPEVLNSGCDRVAEGCSHACAINGDGDVICVCPGFQTIMDDGKTCVEVEEFLIEDQVESKPLSHAPYIFLIVVGIACIVALLGKIHQYI